jgi:uncharacterized membrane protein
VAEASSPAARRGQWLWIALALSLTLNLFVVGGLVWSMMSRPPPRAEAPAERLIAAARSLNLDSDQRVALGTFGVETREATLALRAANAPLMRQMWEEMAKAQPDQAAVLRFADQALENRRIYQRKMTTNLMTFLVTLQPDQRKRFAEVATRRPGGGGGPEAHPRP